MAESMTVKSKWINYLTALVATGLVMLFWSAYDSPLYPLYTSGDVSVFMLIGRGITEGKIPYRDLFDHKGPVLYWIEALGWAIGGRTGIWLLETLCAMTCVITIIKICRKLNANCLLPLLGTAVAYLSYFGRGNLCENYSVPFVYICLYLVVDYYKSGETRHRPLYAFIYGICFGLIAFIRVNNATIICGFILVIMIRLIASKEFGNLCANLLAGVLGILTVAGPICLYYYSKDALQDMLFSIFTFNFMYASEMVKISDMGPLKRAVTYMPITFTTVWFGYRWWKKDDKDQGPVFYGSFFAVALLYFIELLYTSTYGHYHLPALPLYTACLATAFPDFRFKELKQFFRSGSMRIWRYTAGLIICIYFMTSLYNLGAPIYRHYLTDACSSRYKDVQTCIAVIPEEERDSVAGYEIAASWYIDSGITPCYKFFSMQHWLSKEGFDVNQQFLDYVSEEHPLWIIAPKDPGEGLLQELESHYRLETEGEKWAYYRYRG